jgi:prepilin-type N-terminal cleavage/methylation domain-containing protein
MPLTSTTARRRARAGFSLVEMLVAITLVGVLLGALYRVIDRQQRFYAGMGDVMSQRLQLRQAATLLPLELRSISTVGGDILALSDSTIDVRTHVASGFICTKLTGTQIVLPPLNMASGQALTAFTSTPSAGDRIFIYDDGAALGNQDDTWINREVTSISQNSGYCVGAPYTSGSDNGKNRVVIGISGADLPATVVDGAPVRIMRQSRYELYKASDGDWYLGYQGWNGAGYNAIEPVAGPYSAASGIRFQYYRTDGSQVTSAANASEIARVDLYIRGLTSRRMKVDGMQQGQYKDSLAVTVAIRNRNP